MKTPQSNFCFILAMAIGFLSAGNLHAWAWDGHTAVGVLAMQITDDTARAKLEQVLGAVDAQTMGVRCNWPDVIREQDEWAWTGPRHYVNIPRHSDTYDRQRDCHDGLCATETIKKFAARLANEQLPNEERVQAFAWLCHVTGDLHQPLHCGYADDRGGNRVNVVFKNEPMNLHAFWDMALIRSRAASSQLLIELLAPSLETAGCSWSPADTDAWTNESFRLTATKVYPDSAEIDPAYADASWHLVQSRLLKAAQRLATILNAILGEGD